MMFREINLDGVLVSPTAVLLTGSWAVVAAMRLMLRRTGLLQRIWHPALFLFSALSQHFRHQRPFRVR